MNEERLICFDIEETAQLAARMCYADGLEMPDMSFFEARCPMASILAEIPEEGTLRRYIFTVSLPETEGDGLIEELWSNALLNAATLIMEREFRAEAEEAGLRLSDLKGPGLDGLPFELAGRLTAMAHAERIGVTVSEAGVMHPPFTRCGFYLAGTEEEMRGDAPVSGCAGCIGSSQGCSLCMRKQNVL